MDLELEHKVVAISGGSRGIGKAIARAFTAEGAKVSIFARTEDALAQAAREIGGTTHFMAGDVTKREDCARLVVATEKHWGGIDVLICNVGDGKGSPPGTETAEEWRQSFDANFFSTTNLVEAALPALERRGGSILCLSSICGVRTLGAPLPYSAAKAALHSYVQGMARPLAARGVRINTIAPGNVLFEGGTWEKKIQKDREGVMRMLQEKVAQKRFGTPDEIADFSLFLSSPRAAFCTGGIFVADGGQTA